MPADPRVHPLRQARRHVRPRRGDAPLARGPRLLRDPGRHAGERGVRRAPRRRVPRAGAGRRGRGDRVARGPALVLGGGRDVRQELGRLQRPPGRGAPPPGSQGRHHRVLDGRPLRGRHPHHGRLPVAGEPELGVHHARPQRPPPGPAARRPGLARDLDAAARERHALDPRVAAAPAAGRVLEARVGLRGLRGHRVSGLRGGRLAGPLHEPGVPADGAPRRAAQGPGRPVGPPVPAPGEAGAGGRIPRGEPAVVGSVAQGARGGRERGNGEGGGGGRVGGGSRDSGRADDPGLDARLRPSGRGPGAGAGRMGGGGGVAEPPDPGADVASQRRRTG